MRAAPFLALLLVALLLMPRDDAHDVITTKLTCTRGDFARIPEALLAQVAVGTGVFCLTSDEPEVYNSSLPWNSMSLSANFLLSSIWVPVMRNSAFVFFGLIGSDFSKWKTARPSRP